MSKYLFSIQKKRSISVDLFWNLKRHSFYSRMILKSLFLLIWAIFWAILIIKLGNLYSVRVILNETFNYICEPLEWKHFVLVFIYNLILLRVDDICLHCLVLYFWNPLDIHPLFFFNWVLLLIIVSLFFISLYHFLFFQLLLYVWILLFILHNF